MIFKPETVRVVSYINMNESGLPMIMGEFNTLDDGRDYASKRFSFEEQKAVRIFCKAGAFSWTEKVSIKDKRVLAPYCPNRTTRDY